LTDNSQIYKALRYGLGFIAGVAVALYAFNSDASPLKEQAIDPVVKINANCSAVAIDLPQSGNFLLTARHCVKNGSETDREGYFSLEEYDGAKLVTTSNHFFEVERTSFNRDLALLKMRDEKVKLTKAKIATEQLVEEGDNVWATGYPLGWTRTITPGLYNGEQVLPGSVLEVSGEDLAFTRASPAIAGGNSGGGLFQENKGNYELIGITSMGVKSYSHISLFVPLRDIREFLNLGDREEVKAASTDIAPFTPAIKPDAYSIDLR